MTTSPFATPCEELLKSHGYTVAVFPSAAEFLASTQPCPRPPAWSLTFHMPVMTGEELCRHLIATGHVIPTILITAYPEEGVRQRMLSLGVGCYLHKPLDEAVLIDCLRRAFARDKTPSSRTMNLSPEVLWEDAERVFCRLGATMPRAIGTLSCP